MNILDVNFDKGIIKNTNLLTGKLDVRKLAESQSGYMPIYYSLEEFERMKPFRVALLIDESGSMDYTYKAPTAQTLANVLYLTFKDLLPAQNLSIFGHSGENDPELRIYKGFEEDFECYEERSARMFVNRCQNYDGPIVERIYEKYLKGSDTNNLFIVISDGQPAGYLYGSQSDYVDLKKIIEKIRRENIVTLGIGINYYNMDFYKYSTTMRVPQQTIESCIEKFAKTINNVVKQEFS